MSLSRKYLADLRLTANQKSQALTALERMWPQIKDQIFADRKTLQDLITHDDPIRLPVDLLSPLDRALDETTHTRVLSYLFNSHADELRNAPLTAFLDRLSGPGVRATKSLLRHPKSHATAYCEYHYVIDTSPIRSFARCDVWIEIQGPRRKALIVIENKIDQPEGRNQLDRYREEARLWHRRNKGSKPLLVYLTRHEQGTKNGWISASYLDLAAALREVWLRSKKTPVSGLLALYIATLTQHVLGIKIDRLHHTAIGTLITYLGNAPCK